MKHSHRVTLIALLLIAGVITFAGHPLAQNATVKAPGKLKGTVQITQNGVKSGAAVRVYDVPNNRDFVLTDLIISNPNAKTATDLTLRKDGKDVTLLISVQPGSSFVATMQTGMLFEKGSSINVLNGGNSGLVNFMLIGYLK